MQAYDYSRHGKLESGTIRLFKLFPGETSSELKGNLVIRKPYPTVADHRQGRSGGLHTEPYEALSYTWGSSDRMTDSIQVLSNNDVYYIAIHSNLGAALRRLRNPLTPTHWWIDALCINQDDVVEKNVQLPVMPEIYGHATAVAVWLGQEYDRSDQAFSFLHGSLLASDFEDFIQESGRKEAFVGVVRLMKRPWFTRRWVIQEIACARKAHVYCGNADMPWHAFVDAIYQLAAQKANLRIAFSSLFANESDEVESFGSLSTLKLLHLVDNMLRKTVDGRITEHLMTLEALLATTPQFETSDPKDTIYALLFLASDAEATTYEDWLVRFRQSHEGPASKAVSDASQGFQAPRDQTKSPKNGMGLTTQASEIQDGETQVRSTTLAGGYPSKMRSVHNLGYALVRYLGLEALGNKRAIMVDYKKSVLEICRDIMKFVMTHSASVDMLCRPWAPVGMDLPSWVRTKAESAHLPGLNGVYRRVNADPLVGDPSWPVKPYRASSGTEASWSKQGRDFRNLVLQGFVLDRVDAKDDVATAGIIPMSWAAMAGWSIKDGTPPEAFWRTLVGNRNSLGRRAPFHWGQICSRAFSRRMPGQDLDTSEAMRYDCPPAVREFLERVQCVVWSRRLVHFQHNDMLGITSKLAKKGDLLCILKGCSVPVILREFVCEKPTARSGNPDPLNHFFEALGEDDTALAQEIHYEFIGEAYAHGMMDGEAYTHKYQRSIRPHSFRLR